MYNAHCATLIAWFSDAIIPVDGYIKWAPDRVLHRNRDAALQTIDFHGIPDRPATPGEPNRCHYLAARCSKTPAHLMVTSQYLQMCLQMLALHLRRCSAQLRAAG